MFDPSLRYLSVSKGNRPTVSVDVVKLCTDAAKDINSVKSVSIPAMVWKKDDQMFPVLPEFGGGSSDPNNASRCMITSTSTGGLVSSKSVCRISYLQERENGHHGLSEASIGNMFAVGYKMRSDRVTLIYVIDNSEELPVGDDQRLAKVTNPHAVLDCTLVGYALTTWRGTDKRLSDSCQWLYECVQHKINSPSWGVTNFECWFSVAKTEARKATYEAEVFSSHQYKVLAKPVEPFDFFTHVSNEIYEYRMDLISEDHKLKYRAIPVRQDIVLNDDGSVTMYLSVIRSAYATTTAPAFSEEGGIDVAEVPVTGEDADPLVFSTTIAESLPEEMITEGAVVMQARNFQELVNVLTEHKGSVTQYMLTLR